MFHPSTIFWTQEQLNSLPVDKIRNAAKKYTRNNTCVDLDFYKDTNFGASDKIKECTDVYMPLFYCSIPEGEACWFINRCGHLLKYIENELNSYCIYIMSLTPKTTKIERQKYNWFYEWENHKFYWKGKQIGGKSPWWL